MTFERKVPGGGADDKHQGRILLVEDDLVVAKAIRRIIAGAGHSVEHAEDGEAALRLLDRERFDVIVSDIMMPGMSGVELLRHVRERDLDVPVILETAAPSAATAIEAVELGALRYLSKPIRGDELLDTIQRAIRLHRLAKLKREALERMGAPGMTGDRAGLQVRFDRALKTLWMAYQPIIDWRRARLLAYEALVRSEEPTMSSPDAILDAAERLERLHDLGRAVRAQVAADSVAELVPLIFVNLHTTDLLDESLFQQTSPLSKIANRVVLELTERAALDNVPDASARVRRLRALGFRIALDDLGAGYAGLTSFAMLEPDYVKFDISLVRDVDREPIKQKLIASMLGLCQELNIHVIAEGVESEAERDTLYDLGCDAQQGYLFGRPKGGFTTPKI